MYSCYRKQKPEEGGGGKVKTVSAFVAFCVRERELLCLQLQLTYLGPTEHFIGDVLAGFHNSVAIQLEGNDWTFRRNMEVSTTLPTCIHMSSSISQDHVTSTRSVVLRL